MNDKRKVVKRGGGEEVHLSYGGKKQNLAPDLRRLMHKGASDDPHGEKDKSEEKRAMESCDQEREKKKTTREGVKYR